MNSKNLLFINKLYKLTIICDTEHPRSYRENIYMGWKNLLFTNV